MPLPDTPRDIRVNAEEMLLVERAETRRIALCFLNPEPFVGASRHLRVSSR
jgi:hypothetical protein